MSDEYDSPAPPVKHYPRPCMCPEVRCCPLFQTPAPQFLLDEPARDGIGQQRRVFGPGESWMCWGVMPEGIVFEYDGDQHENDLRVCMASPLKGLVAFQENYGDWWAMKRGYHKALERLEARYPERMPQPEPAPSRGKNEALRHTPPSGRPASPEQALAACQRNVGLYAL